MNISCIDESSLFLRQEHYLIQNLTDFTLRISPMGSHIPTAMQAIDFIDPNKSGNAPYFAGCQISKTDDLRLGACWRRSRNEKLSSSNIDLGPVPRNRHKSNSLTFHWKKLDIWRFLGTGPNFWCVKTVFFLEVILTVLYISFTCIHRCQTLQVQPVFTFFHSALLPWDTRQQSTRDATCLHIQGAERKDIRLRGLWTFCQGRVRALSPHVGRALAIGHAQASSTESATQDKIHPKGSKWRW